MSVRYQNQEILEKPSCILIEDSARHAFGISESKVAARNFLVQNLANQVARALNGGERLLDVAGNLLLS